MTDLTRAYDMLTVAAPDLAADNKATNSTAYISQAAVDALRARVSLYHKSTPTPTSMPAMPCVP